SFIFALNIGIFWLGYRFFSTMPAEKFRQFLCWSATAYLLIALTAATINRHRNDINKNHLDVRNPMAYRVQNPKAVADLRKWLRNNVSQAGPDLVRLSNDPEFVDALQSREFYRLHFDEPFQVSHKAVVFGYQTVPGVEGREPSFLLVRFPADLANTL